MRLFPHVVSSSSSCGCCNSGARSQTSSLSQLPRDIAARFADRLEITAPTRHNPKLEAVLDIVNADEDLYGLWIAANVNAVERLNMTDHGPVHVKIVMNMALVLGQM